MRDSFTNFLNNLSTPTPRLLEQIPDERRSEFLRLRRTDIRQR
ncbi:MAG: hypothetical protein ABR606_16610 [Vicinamibacterales bacterium]